MTQNHFKTTTTYACALVKLDTKVKILFSGIRPVYILNRRSCRLKLQSVFPFLNLLLI